MRRVTRSAVRRAGLSVPAVLVLAAAFAPAQEKKPAATAPPRLGEKFTPTDVDTARPVYESAFDDAKALKDWRLEGGRKMSVAGGKLVLESDPVMPKVRSQQQENHLVCWLLKEVPADFLLEF